MTTTSPLPDGWRLFRRAFLWTLAAFLLVWSLKARADDPAGSPRLTVDAAADAVDPAGAREVPLSPPHSSVIVPPATVTTFPEQGWSVTIAPHALREVRIHGIRYEDVYASIPYRRAEYLANPGYRHEAALELMFGQMRPKTVVSRSAPQVLPLPAFSVYRPYRYSQTELNSLYYRPLGLPYAWNFPLAPYYPSYPAYPLLY
jgi:hypothetical protein